MSKLVKKTSSPLLQAAEALEEELRRMGTVAREAQRLPLDSQRNLERTQEKLAELGGVDERLQPLVARLMGAVKDLVDEQQAQAAALAARAEELRRRREVFQQLMASYAELGKASQQLNALVQAFAGLSPGEASGPAGDPPSLEAVQSAMAQLIDSAGEVSGAATRENFEDLARQAESLRQQLLAARNKLSLLSARHARSGVVQ